jgi:hypothetical protein
MTFARRVFLWSGLYGIAVLVPMYFLEERIGRDFPPATNHPEQYYAFLGVALAWQCVFLLIASDVRRYRLVMLPAIAEKFLPAGAALWLYAGGRIGLTLLAPFLVDLVLGVLFALAFLRSKESAARDA